MLLFTTKELRRTLFILVALTVTVALLASLVTHAPSVWAILLLVAFAIATPVLNMYVESARDRYKEFEEELDSKILESELLHKTLDELDTVDYDEFMTVLDYLDEEHQ